MQVSRDAETGISRGTAFVTMRSLAEARTAINALDGFVSHTTPQLQLQFLSLLSKMELLHSRIVIKCIFVAHTNPSSYESLTCTCMCFSLSGLRWA
jgi:RNA recognition motif-containing protein